MRTYRNPYQHPIGFLALLVVCLSSILYSVCFLPSLFSKNRLASTLLVNSSTRPQDQAPFQWKERPKRLIVFGDSASDNGRYLVDPPPENQVFAQDMTQGQVWSERLCAVVLQLLRYRHIETNEC